MKFATLSGLSGSKSWSTKIFPFVLTPPPFVPVDSFRFANSESTQEAETARCVLCQQKSRDLVNYVFSGIFTTNENIHSLRLDSRLQGS